MQKTIKNKNKETAKHFAKEVVSFCTFTNMRVQMIYIPDNPLDFQALAIQVNMKQHCPCFNFTYFDDLF